ncbi:MAG: putative NAD(FAD)-dependent dehydrogenase [Desulfotomaculum sp. 46_80]|nr:MAG: putative NAD(FAD)-dependent dehydrogenase [Desulfotomaculum sp. 46_80]
MITDAGVNLMIGEVVRINKENKTVSLRNGEDIAYDKLVLAVGSNPVIPKSIQGYDLGNVFPIARDEVYLRIFLRS